MYQPTQKQINARQLNWAKRIVSGAYSTINSQVLQNDVIPKDIKTHLFKAVIELKLALNKWPTKTKDNGVKS